MEYNRETVLDELNEFAKRVTEISPLLEDYLLRVAKTGDTMFPWVKLKPLLKRKLELVLDDFYESCPTDNLPPLPNVEPFKFDISKSKIMEAVDLFPSAPFTIQRICELLTTPRKHYKRTDKFMRGLEKNVLVVSTVEPRRTPEAIARSIAMSVINGSPMQELPDDVKGNTPADLGPLLRVNRSNHSDCCTAPPTSSAVTTPETCTTTPTAGERVKIQPAEKPFKVDVGSSENVKENIEKVFPKYCFPEKYEPSIMGLDPSNMKTLFDDDDEEEDATETVEMEQD